MKHFTEGEIYQLQSLGFELFNFHMTDRSQDKYIKYSIDRYIFVDWKRWEGKEFNTVQDFINWYKEKL